MKTSPLLLTLAVTSVLAGCTTIPDVAEQGRSSFLGSSAPRTQPINESSEKTALIADSSPKASLYKGNDFLVKLPPTTKSVQIAGDAVTLNFEQAPISDVVQAILGDLLKLNYSIDTPIQGVITLNTSGPVPRNEILPILESVLQANGAGLTRTQDGFIHIAPIASLRNSSLVVSGGGKSLGVSTVIIPLRHVGAVEVGEILKPLAPPDAIVRIDPIRNIVILMGSSSQISAWKEIIATFDVDMLKGMSVGIFPLEHASVKEAEAAIRLLIGGGGGKEAAPLDGLIRVLPIERLNSLLVVTSRSAYLEKIKTWIERLDRAPENDFEPQLYVYPVQNGTASHLARLLSGVMSGLMDTGSSKASGGMAAQDSGVAPGLGSTSLTSGGSGSLGGASSAAANQSLGSSGGGASSIGGGSSSMGTGTSGLNQNSDKVGSQAVVQLNLGAKIRIVADEDSNSLLIYAPKKDYYKIESALKRLDTSPTQVLIEASILEVTLTDDLKYGVEWYIDNAIGSGWRGQGMNNLNASGPIAPQQPGFSYSLTNPLGAVRAVVNALAEKSLVKVISTPSILVLDNQVARLHVGDQQPILSGTTISDGGNRTESITYKDTGVKLAVTPSVNAGGVVAMTINQSVIDVGPIDAATGQRSFMQREVASRVSVRSGEAVILGGMIRDNQTKGRSGVPILMNVPVMGALFSKTTVESTRTELIVMITPRVLSNDQDLVDITQEMRQRMIGAQLFDATSPPLSRSPRSIEITTTDTATTAPLLP